MDSNYNSAHYQAHKKRLQSEDLESSSFGLPRKKFFSEESFANEMAAMSLDPRLQPQQQQLQQQQQQEQPYYQFYNNRFGSSLNSLSTRQPDKNAIRIDHLSDDEDDDTDTQMQSNDIAYMDINGRKTIINGVLNGLPLELRPGEHKPRIPDFVLEDSELTDPRDKLAYQYILKSLKGSESIHIEVLNEPSTHCVPTSMDID